MLSKPAYFSEIVFSLKDKNIHWPTLVSSFSAVYRVSIPGGYPRRSILLFQALCHGQFLHKAFARDVDIDSGTLVSREPQTRRLCKHNLNFCNVTNTTRLLYGGKIKRDKLE